MNDTLPSSGRLGQVVGKFRLDRLLGSGAMGEVYLGLHVELGSPVAVKVLNRAAQADPKGVARFANEAKAVAAIGHENIAGIIDHDALSDGTPYIVMEFVEGITLRELLVEQGVLSCRQAAQLTLDVLAGLSAAHAKGIVHRDLKPENVRVTPAGRAKVLDFGVAKMLQAPTLTTEGAIVGTPHYMAPEQVNADAIDGRVDVYATGVMLFELVTGQRPFEGHNMSELLAKQLHAAPPWPSKLRPDVPPALEQVILRALEKQPERRFESAQAMSAALAALLPGLDGRAPLPTVTPAASVYTPTRKEVATPGPPPRAPASEPAPAPRRSRLPLVALALVVLTGAAVTAAWVSLTPSTAHEPIVVEAPPKAAEPKAPEVVPPPPSSEPAAEPIAVKPKVGPKPVPRPPEPAKLVEKPPEPPPPEERKTLKGVTIVETGKPRKVTPPDYDPKRFELIGYLPRAKAKAVELMSDAVLINMDVDGVGADGTADLTLSGDYEANYWFRSPSLSKVDPRIPVRDQDIPCKVYVVASARHVETFVADSFDGCREKVLPPWRCTMPEVVKKAYAQGARKDRAGKVTFLSDGTWMLDQGDDQGETAYFSCP